MVLAFRHARLGYDGRTAVCDVDLEIAAGEAVAVLGPNGSGKSTLIRSIFGLATVQAGTVEVFGTDRSRFSAWDRLGYVPQRNTVVGGIPSTVREVVTAGLVSSRHLLRRLRSEDRDRVDAAIASVGLADKASDPLLTLSGGQQRRALVARALASEPELLVLDEPTAGVDAENQEVLAAILAELAGRGITLVLITHELGPVRPTITRTLVLRDGRVAYDGPAAGAPDEHDDAWHHEHAHDEHRSSGTGLGGVV